MNAEKTEWNSMIGIIVLGVLAGWFVAAKWLADKAIQNMKLGKSQFFAFEILTVLIFIAPVADDIIGGLHFRKLCTDLSEIQSDPEKIRGKTVRSVVTSLEKEVGGILRKIQVTHISYRDVESNEELANYSIYSAKGGWLMRALWTGAPLTFKSTCTNEASISAKFKRVD